ncbi:MAG: RNA polymerase sporulation sigma factor SigK [Acutalibacteraceae bacterium]|nr:RNA polymerase sporulation sigma factor SigK [Acutalibacteraceae bacterium]
MIFSNLISSVLYLVLHVNISGGFPKALSSKEEKECLDKIAQGDEDAKKELIEHNLRLVAHIVKKYHSDNVEQDDLISIGTIGLIKAVSSFNTNKGIRFATYGARCIENEILMYFRSLKKSAHDISINDPIDTEKEGNCLTLMDVVSSDEDIIDDIDLAIKVSKLKKFLLNLDERERKIIELRYGLNDTEPLTQREVAAKLKISRSYVSRIEKKALLQLRQEFENSTGL